MSNKKGKAAFFDDSEYDLTKAQEVQEIQEVNTGNTRRITQEDYERGTQGRKGYKMPRINMAFEPNVHEWVKKTAKKEGVSMTDLVNNILKQEIRRRS